MESNVGTNIIVSNGNGVVTSSINVINDLAINEAETLFIEIKPTEILKIENSNRSLIIGVIYRLFGDCGTIVFDISYHFSTFAILSELSLDFEANSDETANRKINLTNFVSKMSQTDWTNIYDCDDPNDCIRILNESITVACF